MERTRHSGSQDAVGRLVAAVLAAAALAAGAAEAEVVTVFGNGLRAGEGSAAFSCAAGVRLPEPDPAAGTDALEGARAAARTLARDLALSGFNMVRLPDLAVPRAGDPATEARLAVQDEFVAACKDEGLRVWAEVLHPVLDFVPTPADADVLDDPATREAWQEAVADTNFPAASLVLAAPWDPRLEILVQRRLRDWARAFNPRTGLRRCDDPAYALFSFSSLWWEDLDAAALPALPPFLERGLSDAWNDWLYERRGTDQALRDLFGLDPGETLASNSVAFPPPEAAPGSARTREQRIFLHWMSLLHLSRLLTPFSFFGQASRTAPRLVRHGGSSPFLKRLSTIALAEPASGGAALRTAPPEDLPLVLDATAGDSSQNPVSYAWLAADAGADVLVLPAGSDPARWSPAAAAFRAGRADPAALRKAFGSLDASAFDFPSAAHARLLVPAVGETPSVLVFPAAGAVVAVARIPSGEAPVFPSGLAESGQPRQFLVCVPEDYPATYSDGRLDHAASFDVSVLHPSARPGACVLLVRAPLRPAPDGAPRPFAVLARGPELARKECLPGGAPPAVSAESGVFRIDGLSSSALLLFRPAAPGPGLLRNL